MAEKPQKDMSKGRISIIIVGMIVAAMTMIMVGFWLANESDFTPIKGGGYDYAIALFAFFTLIFAAFALLNKYLTEGMFFIITALVAIICLILKYSSSDIVNSLVYMMIAYFVCAVIFHIRGEFVFESGSIIAGIALLLICILGFKNGLPFIILAIGGILVLISGCFSLADIGPEWLRARNVSVPKVSNLSYATTVTYSAGTFLTCLVLFSIGIEKGSMGLMTFKIIVAVLTIFTGVYGMSNGVLRRGSDLVILSSYSIISALSDMYGLGTIPFLNLVLAIPLITSAIQEYQEGTPIKAICSALFAVVMVTDAFFGATTFFSVLILLTKIVAMYDSISTWVIFDTGWAPRFMRFNKGRGTFSE